MCARPDPFYVHRLRGCELGLELTIDAPDSQGLVWGQMQERALALKSLNRDMARRGAGKKNIAPEKKKWPGKPVLMDATCATPKTSTHRKEKKTQITLTQKKSDVVVLGDLVRVLGRHLRVAPLVGSS